MAAPVEDFIDTGRMRNRNIRLEVNQEEALLRAAEADGRNVSDEIRRILNGESPNLVERGFLCSTCFAVDCQRHTIPKSLAARQSKASGKAAT